MKIVLVLVFIIITSCQSQQKTNINKDDYSLEKDYAESLVINLEKPVHPIQSYFWGTNLLFWVDDDAALENGKILDALDEINIRLLRYPGGTVADNFHWKTNTLENVNMFPYQEGDSETDFDEFMAVCRKLEVQPSVVVNTQSWAVKGDIEGGAHEAAEWLRYCKKMGYSIKFWEIGNETYWHPLISAEEYAHIINVYSDSLKSVDPTVLIGANGHWNIDFVGTKERIKEGTYGELIRIYNNIHSREDYENYQVFTKENTINPITQGSEKWWPTLIEKSGDNIDMIIVHWYFGPGQLDEMSERLSQVKKLFTDKYPDKNYITNISEYNTTSASDFNGDEHLYLSEAIGKMLQAEVDVASFWPLRLEHYGKSTLLDVKNSELSIIAQIHKKLSDSLKGHLVESSVSGQIRGYASYSGTSCTAVLSGRLITEEKRVVIKLNGPQVFEKCEVWLIEGNRFDYQSKEFQIKVDKNNKAEVMLAPKQLAVVRFY